MTSLETSRLHRETRPLFLILSGPSGVGKDAVLQRMRLDNCPHHFVVTATTRPRRDGEEDGVDYLFVTEQAFLEMKDNGGLLEHAKVYGNWYGVPKRPIEQALDDGRDVVIKTDVQGVRNLRRVVSDTIAVFLAPPSMEELEYRLRSRQTESEERLKVRLATAHEEMEALLEFDYLVVNENNALDDAVASIDAIMAAERCRIPQRQVSL